MFPVYQECARRDRGFPRVSAAVFRGVICIGVESRPISAVPAVTCLQRAQTAAAGGQSCWALSAGTWSACRRSLSGKRAEHCGGLARKGADKAIRELKRIGVDASRALGWIDRAAVRPTKGMKALYSGVRGLRTSLDSL